MSLIRLGIVGYGNLGKGVEFAVQKNPDFVLKGVFTRRAPKSVQTEGAPVFALDSILDHQKEIDVLILCGGSATDLPEQTPYLAQFFNTVDSFDTHAKIPEHFKAVDEAGKKAGTVNIISTGWDPGLFSLNRLYGESFLPDGNTYTFWGKGISQGHSDAIRRIEGVLDARQYTIPIESALNAVRAGENPSLSTRQKHLRECFVVEKDGADKEKIKKAIQTMPNYFDEYDTTVHFVSMESLKKEHGGMPHGGFVLRSGKSSENVNHVIEFSLKLQSNPEFTSGVLVAYARAAYRLNQKKEKGAFTVLDIPPALLSPKAPDVLRKEFL